MKAIDMNAARMRCVAAALGALALAGCAGPAPDGGLGEVSTLAAQRIGQPVKLDASSREAAEEQVAQLLAQPLTADSAVQLALMNNPGLKASLGELGVAGSELVQAGRLRNPSIGFGRIGNGADKEIDRSVIFDLAGLLTMPVRVNIEQRRFEQAKLNAAAQVLRLASETRQAYFVAVAAAQSAAFADQVRGAAEASSELAERMSRTGNWSKLDQARERAFFDDALTQQARARHEAVASREQLARLLGLWGDRPAFTLPDRLPELPAAPLEPQNAEGSALAQRLDVLAARRDAEASAASLGLTRTTRFINVFEAGYANKSASGEPRANGYEVTLELPLFDWGGARVARAEALYMQSVHRTADVAVRARSEVREAYSAYRTNYDIARHYRDQVVPLRKQISDEVLLRYNGMLASVFELLADARDQLNAVNAAIEAQRDFWLAEARLQDAMHGGANKEQGAAQ
ncbi:TolC family protein [Massilia endophytica]|uniref:TolC family protein n=1 Tax=Massilia endophytica TaxID=2899220 RepID=UPI001E574EFE|nr:TolC family protein [Massilia endophytica]UGQ49103.1 TolC family protein [Massilia endophytica]